MDELPDARDEIAEADRLGTLVNGAPEHIPEALPRLLEMLTLTWHPDALYAILQALGHIYREPACLAMLPYADHHDDDVRFIVAANAWNGAETTTTKQLAADTLMALMTDSNDDVRDWATFSLGSQNDIDTPAIRDAFVERLDDEHYDTRCEAFSALARRSDKRAVDPIIDEITGETVGRLGVEAAGMIGDERLLQPLLDLREWWDVDVELLDAAIRRCDPIARGADTELLDRLTDAISFQGSAIAALTPVEAHGERDWYSLGSVIEATIREGSLTERTVTWSVDALLRRAEHDVERAALMAVTDLEDPKVVPADDSPTTADD